MKVREITVSDVAKILGVRPEALKKWGRLFSEYLSPSATKPGAPRTYTPTDIQVLAVICETHDWEEDDGDYSSVYRALNSGEQYEERLRQIAYFATPVFQQSPEELDETWVNGVLIGGMAVYDWLSIAQSFKLCADTLVEQALDSGVPYLLSYPIFYNYRHAIELYLKIATDSDEQSDRSHRLSFFARKLEQKYGARLSSWSQEHLSQWEQVDENSTTFRYGESLPEVELWIYLDQLKTVTGRFCAELEKLIIMDLKSPR